MHLSFDQFVFWTFIGEPRCVQWSAFDTRMCNEQPLRYT